MSEKEREEMDSTFPGGAGDMLKDSLDNTDKFFR